VDRQLPLRDLAHQTVLRSFEVTELPGFERCSGRAENALVIVLAYFYFNHVYFLFHLSKP